MADADFLAQLREENRRAAERERAAAELERQRRAAEDAAARLRARKKRS